MLPAFVQVFVPGTRRETFEKIKHLKTPTCTFANLPETTAGHWGQGLTAAKMKDCVWLRPEALQRDSGWPFSFNLLLRPRGSSPYCEPRWHYG
jgi:hypothetical protein